MQNIELTFPGTICAGFGVDDLGEVDPCVVAFVLGCVDVLAAVSACLFLLVGFFFILLITVLVSLVFATIVNFYLHVF